MWAMKYLFWLMGRQREIVRCGFSIATVDDNLAPRCTEKRDQSDQRPIDKAKRQGRAGNDNLKYMYLYNYIGLFSCAKSHDFNTFHLC